MHRFKALGTLVYLRNMHMNASNDFIPKFAPQVRVPASSLSCTRGRSTSTAPCTRPLVAIPGVPLLSGQMGTCSSGLTVTWMSAEVVTIDI